VASRNAKGSRASEAVATEGAVRGNRDRVHLGHESDARRDGQGVREIPMRSDCRCALRRRAHDRSVTINAARTQKASMLNPSRTSRPPTSAPASTLGAVTRSLSSSRAMMQAPFDSTTDGSYRPVRDLGPLAMWTHPRGLSHTRTRVEGQQPDTLGGYGRNPSRTVQVPGDTARDTDPAIPFPSWATYSLVLSEGSGGVAGRYRMPNPPRRLVGSVHPGRGAGGGSRLRCGRFSRSHMPLRHFGPAKGACADSLSAGSLRGAPRKVEGRPLGAPFAFY
jgi:hypothetical protein